jgi:hypothetical protein
MSMIVGHVFLQDGHHRELQCTKCGKKYSQMAWYFVPVELLAEFWKIMCPEPTEQ